MLLRLFVGRRFLVYKLLLFMKFDRWMLLVLLLWFAVCLLAGLFVVCLLAFCPFFCVFTGLFVCSFVCSLSSS